MSSRHLLVSAEKASPHRLPVLPPAQISTPPLIRLPPISPSNSLFAHNIISCLWVWANISGTVRGAEAQYYSLACDQFWNGFARHCWAPNNRMWSANWWTVQTPSRAALKALSSGRTLNKRRGCRSYGACHLMEILIITCLFLHNFSVFTACIITALASSACWPSPLHIRFPACV